MKTTTFRWLLLWVGTAVGAGASGPFPPADALAEAWQTLANYRPDHALPRFEEVAAQGGAGARTARLGAALSLLAQPSPLPDRVGRARAILTALAADGADEVALSARFYLARLAEFQLDPPDPQGAAIGFRRLIAEHPGSPWAQAAVARLALLLLYTAAGPAEPAARLAAADQLLPAAHQPLAVAELHLVMADAVFHYRLPDALALPHLLAAEQTAALDTATRADVLVQIGEIARLTGQREQAEHYFRIFLAEYPRDARQFPVRKQLAAIGAGTR